MLGEHRKGMKTVIEPHQTPRSTTEIVALADPTVDFPCVMRLHREDPCKGWLLEIHTMYSLDVGHPLEDDDQAILNGHACVERFVEVGRTSLGDPRFALDCRIRLMGNSGDWAMYEFTSLTGADLEAAIGRFSAAYGRSPLR